MRSNIKLLPKPEVPKPCAQNLKILNSAWPAGIGGVEPASGLHASGRLKQPQAFRELKSLWLLQRGDLRGLVGFWNWRALAFGCEAWAVAAIGKVSVLGMKLQRAQRENKPHRNRGKLYSPYNLHLGTRGLE